MPKLRLVHWKAQEAEERAERLRSADYEVNCDIPGGASFLRDLGLDAPAAVVIDLSRLPSQGRDMALLIRRRKSTRHLPLVFVGGTTAKVQRVRELLSKFAFIMHL